MKRNKNDMEGLMHGHGWGVADYPDGVPIVGKQTWAAFHGEPFQEAAARVYARIAVADLRRATVGPTSLENTLPFHDGRWMSAYYGTLSNFEVVWFRVREAMDPSHCMGIRSQTDSAYVFGYLLSLFQQRPEVGPFETVRRGLDRIVGWCTEVDQHRGVSLNTVLAGVEPLTAFQLNRSLYHLGRDYLHVWTVCDRVHAKHEFKTPCRALGAASEPATLGEAS